MVEQVDGDHYLAAYQHWDMVADTRLGYFEANATKYLGRFRKKNGVVDLIKADSYVRKMQELCSCGRDYDMPPGDNWIAIEAYRNRSLFAEVDATSESEAFFFKTKWYDSAEIPTPDRIIIDAVLHWKTASDLVVASQLINRLAIAHAGP